MHNKKSSFVILSLSLCFISACFLTCSSFPVGTPVDSGGRVINAWDESGQARAIIRDGKEYYILTENERLGPYDYVEYERKHDESAQSLYFFYRKNNQFFLTDGKETKYGPYHFVRKKSGTRRTGQFKPGVFFFCQHLDRKMADIFLDNGKTLVKLGTVNEQCSGEFNTCYLSDDGSFSVVNTQFGDRDYGILFNNIPVSLWNGDNNTTPTPMNNGVWLMVPASRGRQYTLRFLSSRLDKNGLPETQVLTNRGVMASCHLIAGLQADMYMTIEAMLKGDSTTQTELIDSFGNGLVSKGRTHVAFRYETEKGAFIFLSGTTGSRRFGPFHTNWEHDVYAEYDFMNGLEFSSDGQALAYFHDDYITFRDGTSIGDKSRYYIGNNEKTFGPYYVEGKPIIMDPLFIEGTHDIVYCAKEGEDEEYWVYLNGKKILGPWDSWNAAELVKTKCKDGERFDGYIQVCHKGKCYLYKLDKLVAGPYDWNKDLNKQFSVVNTPAGDRIIFKKGRGKVVVSDDGRSSAYTYFGDDLKDHLYFNDRVLGTYDSCSDPVFIPGTTDMIFAIDFGRKSPESYLVHGNGTRVYLPGLDYNGLDSDNLTVSPDGKVIEIRMTNYYIKYDGERFDTRYVVINNRVYVGRYNEFTNITVYWDDREQKLKKIVHK